MKKRNESATAAPAATELVFILDKSGSMAGLEGDTIGGFNTLLREHKEKAGTCRLTTVLFDSSIHLLHDRIDIQAVRPLQEADFQPGGCTALYDAIGCGIHKIIDAQRQSAAPFRARQVIFVIMTDGLENASRRFSHDQIRLMIEREREGYGWEFLFLGANIDAPGTAETLGIRREMAAEYLADSIGTQASFRAMSETLESFRECGVVNTGCMEAIREDTRHRSRLPRRNHQ